MAKQLRITKILGSARRLPKQRATLVALGLGKINSQVVLNDTAAIRGMIVVVKHMVRVEEIA